MVLPLSPNQNALLQKSTCSVTNTPAALHTQNFLLEVRSHSAPIFTKGNSISSIPSSISLKQYATINVDLQQSTSSKNLKVTNLNKELRIRKCLNNRLVLISDIMSFLAILSIILMIIANELTFIHINTVETKTSWFIKLFISFITIILLVLIIYYHYLDLKIFSNHNALKYTTVGLTNTKIFLITIELIICIIHPMPRCYPSSISSEVNPNILNSYPLSYIATDVGLGIPMFLRLYLLSRSIMFHSHLVLDASLRSLGCLNQVSINFFFLMKTFLEQWPTRCLFILCTFAFFTGSWCLRACNYQSTREHFTIFDSMWLFIITFTTVGYGDIYPSTYCGRTIIAIIGLFGLLASALLIAVLAQKLLLSREEKYVHTFVLNIELAKKRKHQAANVIKFSIKLWYLNRKHRQKYLQYMAVQRKLFQAINQLQKIKFEQKKLIDHCIGPHELMALQRNLSTQYEKTEDKTIEMEKKMMLIEGKLDDMAKNMNKLHISMNILLDYVKK